ncbi:hypothetical protein [Macrococcus equipercicus]|uniref:Uncharacterized protein n=1 Tax=Macrococcus equipercicus TaxID=69967 RepID=A0A9Q9BMD2_9STAP|nr:hypothetical protein [Macrococcus equipercicus]KAA1038428.1 hypothetical protein ERX35_008760 [Macrococcus equipercicus]UTH13185.1 hypothetical protein KFV11_07900 [Macrococcus equipercicus]
MRCLKHLFSGKLTAYQIATATGIEIDTITDLAAKKLSLENIDQAAYNKLLDLETSLFTSEADQEQSTNETSA